MRGDFRGAAGTGQARVRTFVMTDYGGVEVAEAVNLRRTEKAHVHTPCLQVVAEDLRQRHDAGRGLRQFAITDGQRQYLGPAADGSRFIDQYDVRCMSQPGQITGRAREADADEADVTVVQQACGGHGHHFVPRGGTHGLTASS